MMGGWGLCVGAFSVFLPTFINEFGFTPLETQLYSMIPYAFGFFALVMMSFVSDYLNHRAFIIFGSYAVTILGFIILLTTTNKVALMAGLCFVLAGVYPGTIVSVAWTVTFHGASPSAPRRSGLARYSSKVTVSLRLRCIPHLHDSTRVTELG